MKPLFGRLSPPKRKCVGWVNVYLGGELDAKQTYPTRGHADEAAGFPGRHRRVACVCLKWEEPL